MNFQPTATRFGLQISPHHSVQKDDYLIHNMHFFKYGCCILKTLITFRDVINEFDNISCCTVFIIYLLLLYVSAKGHSHLQGATRILDVYSIYFK